jgi:GntR family transcriptional regulator
MVNKNSSTPFYMQIREYIQNRIDSYELKPGDRIQSEMALSGKFSVSRMTVKKAVDALVTEGLLFRQPGKGTFVSSPKAHFPGPTISSFTETMRNLGYEIKTEILHQEIISVPKKVTEALDIKGDSVLILNRLRYLYDEPVAIHISYMRPEIAEHLKKFDLTTMSLNFAMEEILGRKILTSTDVIESTLATPDESKILHIKEKSPILIVHGVVYDDGGDPVRVTKALWRGDRVKFSITGGFCQIQYSE